MSTYKWLGVSVLAPLRVVISFALLKRVSANSSRALKHVESVQGYIFSLTIITPSQMLKYDESANKKWESLLLLYWEYIIKNEL